VLQHSGHKNFKMFGATDIKKRETIEERDKPKPLQAMKIPQLKELILTALASGNENHIPPLLRKQFAKKVWTLLAIQLVVMWIVACIIDYLLPAVETKEEGYIIWGIGIGFAFISLACLYAFRNEPYLNHMMLGFVILTQGVFWGLSRYVVGYFAEGYNYCLHFVGITGCAVFISALACQTSITETIAVKVMPVYERESRLSSTRLSDARQSAGMGLLPGQHTQPSWPVEQKKALGDQGMKETIRQMQRASVIGRKSNVVALKDAAIMSITSENDGIMRATVYIAIAGWIFAWIIDVIVLAVLESTMPSDTKVSIKAAGMAGAMALPLVLFLHIDLIRQMRRTSIDDYMRVIVLVNADMFGFLIGLAVIALIIVTAEGEQMQASEDDGGGGGASEAAVVVPAGGGGGASLRGASSGGAGGLFSCIISRQRSARSED